MVRTARKRQELIDEQESQEPFLEPLADGTGWRFIARPPSPAYSNTEVGYLLLNIPWRSGWRVEGKDDWAITDRTRRRGMGLPHEWAMKLLEKSGMKYRTVPE